MSKKISVLFVCLGNICRSPMAEAVFREMVRQKDMAELIEVDSAGTADWHTGKPPHEGTQQILKQYKIPFEGIQARQVKAQDLETYDYIIAMDTANERDLHQLEVQAPGKVIKLLDLVPEIGAADVPDPYYTGNFEEVYDMVTGACRVLLADIRTQL